MKSPRSKLAIGFYVIGTLMLLKVAYPVILLSSQGVGGAFGFLYAAEFLQPILWILSGGVVQILSDIRWALLRDRGEHDA